MQTVLGVFCFSEKKSRKQGKWPAFIYIYIYDRYLLLYTCIVYMVHIYNIIYTPPISANLQSTLACLQCACVYGTVSCEAIHAFSFGLFLPGIFILHCMFVLRFLSRDCLKLGNRVVIWKVAVGGINPESGSRVPQLPFNWQLLSAS